MNKQNVIPDPEKRLKVTKRYLHTLSLLQNNKDSTDWNGATLADLLSLDEQEDTALSDKSVRDYINENLIDEMGLNIDIGKGSRRIELKEPIEKDMLQLIAHIYSSFVVKDSAREIVLKNLINKHPYDCLWMLARIYFASIEKKKIKFDYTNNANYRIRNTVVCPYHLVFRNNNLYLVARQGGQEGGWLYIVNRIENIKVLDEYFDDDVPSVENIFKDTLGSFIGEKYRIKIRFDESILQPIEQVLSILEPVIKETEKEGCFEAVFSVSDDRYLCKQLFLYGSNVEIVEPRELRNTMIEMLKDSISAY